MNININYNSKLFIIIFHQKIQLMIYGTFQIRSDLKIIMLQFKKLRLKNYLCICYTLSNTSKILY